MLDIYTDTVELAEIICESEEVKIYLDLRREISTDVEAQELIRRFQRLKENYEMAQRFGIFHPDYHKARKDARVFQKEMHAHPLIKSYLTAEERVDYLLYEVSRHVARAVSEAVMVPNSNWNKPKSGCNCKG